MACGYGACFGCAVPDGSGGYARLCVDGPVVEGSRGVVRRARRPLFRPTGLCGASDQTLRRKTQNRGTTPTPLPARHPSQVLRPRACPPHRQRLGDLRCDRRPQGLRGRDACVIPLQRLRLEDDHAGAAGGNEPQRIWETPAGMINSIGLSNKGLEGFLAEDLPQLAELPVPLVVSVMGTSHEEFARLVRGVGERTRLRRSSSTCPVPTCTQA